MFEYCLLPLSLWTKKKKSVCSCFICFWWRRLANPTSLKSFVFLLECASCCIMQSTQRWPQIETSTWFQNLRTTPSPSPILDPMSRFIIKKRATFENLQNNVQSISQNTRREKRSKQFSRQSPHFNIDSARLFGCLLEEGKIFLSPTISILFVLCNEFQWGWHVKESRRVFGKMPNAERNFYRHFSTLGKYPLTSFRNVY